MALTFLSVNVLYKNTGNRKEAVFWSFSLYCKQVVKFCNRELKQPSFQKEILSKGKKGGLEKEVGLFMEEAFYLYRLCLECLLK